MNVLRILYRGSLSSCNYGCDYCPFSKTTNTREELQKDASEVKRFTNWVETSDRELGIFFTPWGEAIIHKYYRQSMIKLSRMQNVHRVVMQTNLSCRLDDFVSADRQSLALWATFHPTQTSLNRFIERCHWLSENQIRYSVGVVGLREHFDSVSILRNELPPNVYLWINSYKRQPDYYRVDELTFLRSIDPYFEINRHYYPSQGKPCDAGQKSFTVNGQGEVHRCHFIDQTIGNIYEENIFEKMVPRECPNSTCGCHIGYVHRPEGKLHQLFGKNLLERIPDQWPELNHDFINQATEQKNDLHSVRSDS